MSELLIIVGPTGVGKTALAIELAKKFNGELISADSRQIYIGMDIATGKEVQLGRWEEYHGRKTLVIEEIPVHGLDLVWPDSSFSVYDWLQCVGPIIEEVKSRQKLPIVVGGTGFYLRALQGEIGTLAIKPNVALREELAQMSLDELAQQLELLDEKTYAATDTQNRRRLTRAIEVVKASGQEGESEKQVGMAYDLTMIGLTMERTALYGKVDARIEQMFGDGLIEETRRLLTQYDQSLPSMTGIGYAEVAMYLMGEMSLEEAKQAMKWRVHSYIRRQYTWFKKQKVHWVDLGQPDWQNTVDALVVDRALSIS